MLNLFTKTDTTNYGNMLTPLHGRLVDVSKRNMERALEYWRSNGSSILNTNLVLKLIKELPVPGGDLTQLSFDKVRKYYEDIRDKDYQYGNKFNLTTSTRYGAISKSEFYDDSVDEIIISNSTPFHTDMVKHWRNAEPVRVHRHPYNVTYYGLLARKTNLGGNGVAVLTINIPLLALQYLMWLREEASYTDSNGGKRLQSTYMFVAKYPIPNLLKSHNDIAIINRFIGRYHNELDETRDVRQAFWLNDELALMDQVIVKTVVELKRQERLWPAVLLHLPSVWRNGQDAVHLPIDIEMRQNRWAWYIACLWMVDFLCEHEASFKKRKNGEALNNIIKELQRIKSDNTFYLSGLTPKIKNVVSYELGHIADMIKLIDKR